MAASAPEAAHHRQRYPILSANRSHIYIAFHKMPKFNWKSLFLFTPTVLTGAVVLVSGILTILRLPLLGWTGLVPVVTLIVITLISSRLIVPVTSVDGSSQSNKSVADSFIFLALIMYVTAPA